MKRTSCRGVIEEQEKDRSGAFTIHTLFYIFMNKYEKNFLVKDLKQETQAYH